MKCPHCNQPLAAPPGLLGVPAACPACGGQFVIPEGARDGTAVPPPLANSTPVARAPFPAIGQTPTTTGATIRRQRSSFPTDPIDVQFEKYLTPWIVRIIWIGAIVAACIWALFVTELFVKRLLATPPTAERSSQGYFYGDSSGRTQETWADWMDSKTGACFGYFVSLVFGAAFLLSVRMMLECVIVVFKMSMSLGAIEKAIDSRRAIDTT